MSEAERELQDYKGTGPHVEPSQKFFVEYQQRCFLDLNYMIEDLRRWESMGKNIVNIPLEEQKEYADYVTKKLCVCSDEIIASFAKDMIASTKLVIKARKWMNTCAVGNCAYIIDTLKKKPSMKDLHDEALKVHQENIQMIKQYH